MRNFLFTLLTLALAVGCADAQYYVSPQIGFKVYGLSGAGTEKIAGQVAQLGITDAGGTAFNAGVGLGYELKFPTPIYRLDLEANLSWSSINFFQNAYDNNQGAGSFAASGYSGGGAQIFSLDLMPIHRFMIPDFFISPFAGVGLSMNLFDNTNTTGGPPDNPAGTIITGSTDFQLGLSIFYGAYFNVLPHIEPFIQFKHLIPFAGTYQFTDNATAPGITSEPVVFELQNAPGYFNLDAGVRFNF